MFDLMEASSKQGAYRPKSDEIRQIGERRVEAQQQRVTKKLHKVLVVSVVDARVHPAARELRQCENTHSRTHGQ